MPKIEVDVVADLSSLKAGLNEATLIARDTKKKLDATKLVELQLDVVNFQNKLKQARDELKKTTDAKRKIELEIDINTLSSNLTEAKRQLQNFRNTGDQNVSRLQVKFDGVTNSINGIKSGLVGLTSQLGGLGSGIASVFQAGGIAGGILGVGVALTESTKRFATFEKAADNAKAILGLFGEEGEKAFKPLNDLALDLGATTKFTAQEAAEGIAILGQAGFSTNEIMKALPGTLNLAAAANISIAQAADVTASVLRQFQLDASETDRVLDILTKTSIDSNVSISDLQESFKFFGPTAKALGISVEESAAAIGILGDAGIKGSVATRALGTAFANLSKPTNKQQEAIQQLGLSIFDAQGKFVGLGDLFGQIAQKTANYTQEQKIAALSTLFGNEAIQEAIVLTDNRAKIVERTNGLLQAQGTTDKIAKEQLDNLAGSYEQLLGAIDSLAIKIGGFLAPAVRSIIDGFTGLVQRLTEINPIIPTIIGGVVALAGVFTGIGVILPVLTTGITALGAAFTLLLGPIGLITAGVTALTIAYSSNLFGLQDFVNGLSGVVTNADLVGKSLTDLTAKYDENKKKIEELTEAGKGYSNEALSLKASQDKITQAINDSFGTIDQLTEKYNANKLKLQELDEQKKQNIITDEQYQTQTQALIQEQTLLEQRLGAVEVASINARSASEAFNNARLDTTVSREELERLKQKAIEATQAVIAALQLQLQQQQKTSSALKNIGTVGGIGQITGVNTIGSNFINDKSIEQTQKKIQDAQKDLENLQKTSAINIKPVTNTNQQRRTTGGGGGGGGRGGKTEAQKVLEEQQKLQEKIDKENEQFAKEQQKRRKDLANKEIEAINDTADAIEKQIDLYEDTAKGIAKIEEEIDSLNTKLGEIDTEKASDLATRFVEIQQEIAKAQEELTNVNQDLISEFDPEKKAELLKQQQDLQNQIQKLQEEGAKAQGATTQEAIQRADLISKETETDRILRQAEEDKAEVQAEIAKQEELLKAEQEKRDEQLRIIQGYYVKLEAQDKAYLATFTDLAEKQKQIYNELIAKAQELASVNQGVSSADTEAAQNIVNNNQKNITQNFSVSNQVVGESIARKTAMLL